MSGNIVKIQRAGVPCGLFVKRIEPGFVLENGSVLLESEKDGWGRYIGGASLDGMYLPTPERYQSVRDSGGEILGFCRA